MAQTKMPNLYGVDHRMIAGSLLAVTTGVAVLSTVKLWRLKRRLRRDSIYETQKFLNMYLITHYGAPEETLRWDFGPKNGLHMPVRCADLCLEYYKKQRIGEDLPNRALDVGCTVGRAAFELTKVFDEVVGVDASHAFIATCDQLKATGQLEYTLPRVGDLNISLKATVPKDIKRERAVFQQGDACNLPLDIGNFGCVMAANLICRLPSPKYFLQRLANLVAPGGVLVITSPYTFLPQFTHRKNWIAGFLSDGKEVTGIDGLKSSLGQFFDLVDQREFPFLLSESEREYRWSVAETTVWIRKKEID